MNDLERRVEILEEAVIELQGDVDMAKDFPYECKLDDLKKFFYRYCPECGKCLHTDYAKIVHAEREGEPIKYHYGMCLACSVARDEAKEAL